MKKNSLNIFLLGLSFTVMNLACTKKAPTQAKLKIQFDQLGFGTNTKHQTKNIAQSAGTNGLPPWGLADPSSLADINCFGIFVGGPEQEMKNSQCSNFNGTPIEFGPRAGLFPISGPGEIEVLAGENRKIYLFGMSSADGTCEGGFENNPDLNAPNYSNPFIIGQATADLTNGENVVELPIVDQFSDVNKIRDCSFFNDGQPQNYFDMVLPSSDRSLWVIDNNSIRTVDLQHNGVNVQCSRNGTSNYGDCDSLYSFTWNPGDESDTHFVRVEFADGTFEERNFTPTTAYPNLTAFKACDYNLSGAIDFDDANVVAAMGAIANETICFADGAVISSGTTNRTFTVTSAGVTLIARQGDFASINATDNNYNTLELSADNINVLGLNINSAVGSTYHAVNIPSGQNGITFQEVNISLAPGTNGNGIHVDNSGMVDDIDFYRIHVDVPGPGTALFVTNSLSDVEVNQNSYLRADGFTTLITNGANFDIRDSQLLNFGLSVTNRLMRVFNGAYVTANQVHFQDASGGGVELDDNGASSITLDISNSMIERDAFAGGANSPFITSNVGSGPVMIDSAANGNFICNRNSAIAEFTAMTDGNQSGGSWADSNQLGDTTYPYATCP